MRLLTLLLKALMAPIHLTLWVLTAPFRLFTRPAKNNKPLWQPPADANNPLWTSINERRAQGGARGLLWQEVERRRANDPQLDLDLHARIDAYSTHETEPSQSKAGETEQASMQAEPVDQT